ncbi:MAG: hypothetical protein E6713_18240 [Sporomusaceae bacterium]|nr:hypothetical protein [Sporomusaceae bacterium]
MKKIFLILLITLFTSNCFAEDVFIANENGYTKYLRSETANAKVLPKSDQLSTFEMTYSLLLVPDKPTLDMLKNQTLDNKIAYKKQTFIFKCSFNKIQNQWNPDGTLWITNDEIWGGAPTALCLYQLQGNMPAGPYYGDTPEANTNRNTVIAIYNYIVSHNLITYY